LLGTMQIRMILWTLVAVFAVGAGVIFSLLEPPRTLNIQYGAPVGPVAIVENPDREPASTTSSGKDAQFAAVSLDGRGTRQAIDLNLPCTGKSLFAPSVTQVRLIGSACGGKLKIEKSDILNESNGFSATVFVTGTETFETDYISLSPGPNRIRIQHAFKSGEHEDREYLIERTPATAAN
jgi:hypothetical protein